MALFVGSRFSRSSWACYSQRRGVDPLRRGPRGQRVDETLVWNQVMLDAIVASTLGNPQTMRMAATVNTAMFDAQNGVGRRTIQADLRDRPGAARNAPPRRDGSGCVRDLESVLSGAAEPVRRRSAPCLSPSSTATTRTTVQRGIEWGENVANQILAWRATDGFSDPVPPFTGAGAVIGQWESATGTSMAAGNISFTTPFVLTSNTQFQSAFPRPWATLDSAEYAARLQRGGDDRREDRLLSDPGSNAHRVLLQRLRHQRLCRSGHSDRPQARKTSRRDNSRIFALLTIAMHDTSVTVFRAKRDFGMNPADVTWRPIFAIPKADLDGNPDTAPISGWVPLITTPNHPEYPASHPGSHGAGPRVLQHFFGDATRSRFTPRSTPSSRDLRRVECSRGATRASRTWRRKASPPAPTAACTSAARAMRRQWWAPRSPTTSWRTPRDLWTTTTSTSTDAQVSAGGRARRRGPTAATMPW